ncbi:MAG: hypothetical protein M1831_002030 [Alyxoria varia]|nr:MAG: hypothetical protein M1831_002030 [Alyxoria varia]
MADLDPRVASILDGGPRSKTAGDEDEDALIDQLEDDEALDGFRERRIQQLHSEFTRAKQMKNSDHGLYDEVKDEKAVMDITTSTKLCIVHFWKHDFNRCRIMDSHLETLAPIHLDTRFIRVDVTNAPFLVTKLKVQMLPCLIAFIDGVGVDRIVGFEGLGRGTDKFTTRDLEARLLQSGALLRSKLLDEGALASSQHQHRSGIQRSGDNDDDEDDWD